MTDFSIIHPNKLKIKYKVESSLFILLLDLTRFPSKSIIKMKCRPRGWDDVEKDIRKLGESVNVASPVFSFHCHKHESSLHSTCYTTLNLSDQLFFSDYQRPFFPRNPSKSPTFLGTASDPKSGPEGQFR